MDHFYVGVYLLSIAMLVAFSIGRYKQMYKKPRKETLDYLSGSVGTHEYVLKRRIAELEEEVEPNLDLLRKLRRELEKIESKKRYRA